MRSHLALRTLRECLATSVAALLLANPYGLGAAADLESSNPPDDNVYIRPVLPGDFSVEQPRLRAPVSATSAIVRNVAVLAGIGTGTGNEPSIAVDPAFPNRISATTFAGGWGATAPIWFSTDGGLDWVQLNSITSPPGRTGGGPNDQTIDYGRGGVLFGTFLSALNNGANNNIYTGSSLDQFLPATSQWFLTAPNTTQPTNYTGTFIGVDQPWMLVNRDPATPAQDNVYTAFDDLTNGNPRVSVALGPNWPPSFTRNNSIGTFNGGGINPGLRMAVDPLSGKVYCMWQRYNSAGAGGSKNIDYMLNRSSDGGQTWGLNGNANGIIVANADSVQPTPKFGTVNALLGGVTHVAVDPSTGDVYCAYGTRDGTGNNRIAIRRLQDNGSGNLIIGPENLVAGGTVQAALPSIAIATNGTVAVLYMTFDGFSSQVDPTNPPLTFPIYSGHLAMSFDHGTTFNDENLLTFLSPATDNGNARQRVLGDYHQLKAVGRYVYGCFPGGGIAFGQAAAGIDPIFVKAFTGGPLIKLNTNDMAFGGLCADETKDLAFEVFNTGTSDLHILSIVRTSGSDNFALLPNPTLPTTIQAGEHVSYTLRFSPASPTGAKSATFTITTNDPDTATTTVVASGTLGVPAITSALEAAGHFGNVCRDTQKGLSLTIFNGGDCPLIVSNIARISGDPEFAVGAGISFPFAIAAGTSANVPLTFAPTAATSFGPHAATFRISSNDPAQPTLDLSVDASVPPPVIDVNPCPLDFGSVCAEDIQSHEKQVSICNNGLCALTVMNIELVDALNNPSPDFTIQGSPTLPLTINGGSACYQITIKFTPTSEGLKTATLRITSNDPVNPIVTCDVTGETVSTASIAVPELLAFPPTVIDTIGPCVSALPLEVLNSGPCRATVTTVTIVGPDAGVFSLVGLPPLDSPVELTAGEQLGDGNLAVQFQPSSVKRWFFAEVHVTYVIDPSTQETDTLIIPMAGEGVKTGMRILVRVNGLPVPTVKSLKVQAAVGAYSPSVRKQNLALQTVTAPSPFTDALSFPYHLEFGGESTPKQRFTGEFTVTATMKIGKKIQKKVVKFNLETCTFNGNLVVDF